MTDHLVETFDDKSSVDANALGTGSDVSGLATDGPLALDGEGSAFESSFPSSRSFVPGSGFDSGSFFMDDGSVPFEWTDPVWTNLWSGEPHSNMTPWALQSAGIAMAVIGLLALLPGVVTRLLAPLGALGSISLTAYVFHPILIQDVWTWTDPISSSFTHRRETIKAPDRQLCASERHLRPRLGGWNKGESEHPGRHRLMRLPEVGHGDRKPLGDDLDIDPHNPLRRCELVDGTPLHPNQVLALLGVATIRRIVLDTDSKILDIGRSSRNFPRYMKDAATATQRGQCSEHGCDAKPTWLHADHIIPWTPNDPSQPQGRTATRNLQMLCGNANHAKSNRPNPPPPTPRPWRGTAPTAERPSADRSDDDPPQPLRDSSAPRNP